MNHQPKVYRTHIKLLSLFLLVMVSGTIYAQKKAFQKKRHALIFAIGDYPEEGGWGKISSARDVGYIKATLIKQKFDPANIKVVADSTATKKGIEDALKTLIASVGKGDVVVIHFSSHGEQIADDNKDEADGLDEAIVAYDAKFISKTEEKEALVRGSLSKATFDELQVNYFRDDEFGKYIQQLRQHLGEDGDVLVIMDNCHSGSGTRGTPPTAKTRGGMPPLTYEGYIPEMSIKKDEKDVFKDGGTTGDDNGLATYVVISAAQASQLNYETIGDDNVSMGSLTYAFSKVFENIKEGTTYRTLTANIQAIMAIKAQNQTPVIEGNGLDRKLFGGEIVYQEAFFEVQKIVSPLEIIVASGSLAGLSVGAKVTVYPNDTQEQGNGLLLAKGLVTKANHYTATIKLDKALKETQPTKLFVFMSEPVFNVRPIVVAFAPKARGGVGYNALESAQITAALKNLKLVSLVGEPELFIEKGDTSDVVRVAANGYVFAQLKNATDTATLRKVINRYAQYQFLNKITLNDPTLTAQVRLIPLVNGKPDQTAIDAPYADQVNEYMEGAEVVLMVKNSSKKDIYINILDLQPDGIVNAVLPNTKMEDQTKNITPADLKVKAGETRVFEDYIIGIGRPYGTEIFKVFITAKEINLEGLATPGVKARGNLSLFEELVQSSKTIAARGTTVTTRATDGTVFNLVFRIKERQQP